MSMPYFGAIRSGPAPELHSGNVRLVIRQQPKTALVTISKKEKNRKPIDPPPIVQLEVRDHIVDPSWLVSPYLFLIATLLSGEKGDEVLIGDQYVIGQSSSSLNRLKDVNNKDGGFFVFGDISVRKTGWYRLRFSLFNQNKSTHDVEFLTSVDSGPFIVQTNKDFSGLSESSHLSRTFSDQGVRLRLRKEQRKLNGQKRGYNSVDDSLTNDSRQGAASRANDYGYGGPVVKRQRADSDYSANTPSYSHIPTSGYTYSGSNMTPGGYGGYSAYDNQNHGFHQGQDYGSMGLSEGYQGSGQMVPDHYSSIPRLGSISAPPGSFQGLPIKEPQSEQTSYFSGYPTPTKSGSYSSHMNSQSTGMFGHASIPQHHHHQQHYLPAESDYGGRAGSTNIGEPMSAQQNLYHSSHMLASSMDRPISAAPSHTYSVASSATESHQAFSNMNGYNSNSMLYPGMDTMTTTGAMPPTALTSSTLNSPYTGQFGDDAKGHPPLQQQPASYPAVSQGHHVTLDGI